MRKGAQKRAGPNGLLVQEAQSRKSHVHKHGPTFPKKDLKERARQVVYSSSETTARMEPTTAEVATAAVMRTLLSARAHYMRSITRCVLRACSQHGMGDVAWYDSDVFTLPSARGH